MADVDEVRAVPLEIVHRSGAPLIFLWVAWAILLATAMILGNVLGSHAHAAATAARMGSSVVLVIAGWWTWLMLRQAAIAPFALAIAIGMTLGAIGDFFNAGLLKFIPLPSGTLGGIAAFGLGHIAYIAGCVWLARRTGLTARWALAWGIGYWQLFGVIGWYLIVMQGSENRDLVWPALPYSLLLAGTAGITTGLGLQSARLLGLAAGAALFLLSDLILAFELFRGHFAYDTEMVWLNYSPGQMLIVFAVLPAAAVLASRVGQGPRP